MIDQINNLLSLKKSVIPSGGGPTKKAPVVDWTLYQKRLPTTDEVRKWYNELHPTLWGIVTGEVSGIVVFDTDDKSSIEVFEKAGLSPHVVTKRGQHYYFKHPGHLLINAVGILPHLDLRGDGGFVNCLGKNDNAYYSIKITPTDDSLYSLTQLPMVVKEALLTQGKKTNSTTITIGDTIKNGSRNATLASLAGSLKHRGLPLEVIELTLLDANKQICKPPLLDSEVLTIAKSINRYEQKALGKTKPLGPVPL